MNRKSQLIYLARKAIRRIVKAFKLVAAIASIFKAFNLIASFFNFIVGLFDRD
jgi:hypothetical protein